MALKYFSVGIHQNAIAMNKEKEEKNEGEWIWVTGYKGTDKDMKCRGIQFNLNEKYDMPEGEDVVTCKSGFHFCKSLRDVFRYYDIGDGNRFFEVSALIRKSDWESSNNKFAAKSIIFTSECTINEIFRNTDIEEGWTTEDKEYALEHGLKNARKRMTVDKLVGFGFSRPFADLIMQNDKGDIALAVGSQPDLSMDMKVYVIFTASDATSALVKLRQSLKNFNFNVPPLSMSPYASYGTMGR